MALQDLTPQLRTRLNRMERAVGWFVFLATALLVFGFGYYIYKTATRKGWFIPRASYFTFSDRATGLKVGDPVVLMGFEVGRITTIDTMDPWSPYNVYLEFEIKEPYNGYLWTGHNGSRAKVTTADLLGKRVLEVTKGFDGYPAYKFHPLTQVTMGQARTEAKPERWLYASDHYDGTLSNRLVIKATTPVTQENLQQLADLGVQAILVLETNIVQKRPTVVWSEQMGTYTNFVPQDIPEQGIKKNIYWLASDETPAITERLEAIVGKVEAALPNILDLTNKISALLTSGTDLTSNLNFTVTGAQPALSNLTALTARLQEPGALGDLVLGIEGRKNTEALLGNANLIVAHADTNLTATLESLTQALDQVAGITSNLNAQVQANTNILTSVSQAVKNADDFVQGLKRHWLLRSAFKPAKTNAPTKIKR